MWSQAVVGNTVYAGGRFNNARPAGAAAGTNLTPRGNLLAFDITTGNLITSFAPSLNGQVLGVSASPDGTRVYVVGDFTTANGQARRRVAAYSTATGQLITSFNPVGVNSQARAVFATNTTVYVGGGFAGAGGTARNNLAAFRASDGALTAWHPNADYTVWALTGTNDGSAIYAGGSFQNVGGQPAYGLAKVDGNAGALDANWHPAVRNAGADAGVTSLRMQNNFVYGTTYHFGPGGNLEGLFKAAPGGTGEVAYLTDCHGDNYSSFLANGTVYTAGHAHYCGNMGGGFPQYSQWKFAHAQAWSDTDTGEILNDVHGYFNWHGLEDGPALKAWTPEMAMGSFTGQYQAGWNVVGNNDYVVYGGEFPRVNGVGQQGLVRFARRPLSPRKEGVRFPNNSVTPTLRAVSPTEVRVTWPAGFDRDNFNLTYRVMRGTTTVFTTTANSTWWNLPALGYKDGGLTPGSSYTYRIVVSDADGNTVNGASASITMPTSVPGHTSYANALVAKNPRIYWPLNDTRPATGTMQIIDRANVNGTTRSGVTDGVADNDVTAGQPGAIAGDAAVTVGTAQPDQDWGRIYANGIETARNTFTAQAWIKTNTTSGGRILGFGDLQQGNSGHRDRHIYMTNEGRIVFGVKAKNGSLRTVTSGRAYNDNQWHQITATMSPQGMVLYVDGMRVARRTDTTAGEVYLGAWRLQGDNLDGWPSRPSRRNFVGSLDEVAIFDTALSLSDVRGLYTASGRTPGAVPPAPADTYGAAVYADDPDLFWRFDEVAGTTAVDSSISQSDGTYTNGPILGVPGALAAGTAASFDGGNDFVASQAAFGSPGSYTLEGWFKTNTTSGGKIIGFGDQNAGSSNNYDRHVYMQNDGKLVFGTYTGQLNTITTTLPYNDNEWHYVVATQSSDGMKLFVDSVPVGTNPQVDAQPYSGYWKVGGDHTWGSSSDYIGGSIDEVAVYPYALPAQRVTDHYIAAGYAPNESPTAAFTTSTAQRRVSVDGTSSSDPDGTVAAYSWNWGDGATSTGATAQHVFNAAGTYTVTLTVTDDNGATATVSKDVTVTVPPGPADNYGAAVYSDNPVIFWRLNESSGSVANDASGSGSDGTYFNGYTQGVAGALPINNKAVTFNGSDGFVSSNDAFTNPTVYTEEAWFKTASTSGGKIVGFGANRTGSSWSYDRHVYMKDDGHLVFGTWTGQENIITTPAAYNNDQWHHVVATQSSAGMKLYVDGELQGTNPQPSAEAYSGYWKVGGDVTWGGSTNHYFDGTIDEVAIYTTELSAARVAAHYAAAAPAPNQQPAAQFTTTVTDLNVAVDGSSSSDPDGSIVSYAWDFGDGWVTTEETADYTYAKAGTYTVKLTVTDDDGATATTTRSVTVRAANVNPTARFSSNVTNLSVAFDANTSSDADGTIESYSWNFGDGTTGTGKTPSHTYASAGNYTVTLTVVDDRGGSDVVSHQVTTTTPPNQAPTATFSSSTTGLTVSVNGNASSDPDGTVQSHAWNFGDGATATGATASHTYASAGDYTVTLTATDNDGATDEESTTITVGAANQEPTARFTHTETNLQASFSGSTSSDPDGSITEYAWSFGDGSNGTGATPTHTYATAGTYSVTLTVTDDDGATDVVTHDVTVTAPANQAPTASFTVQTTQMSVAVNGSASSDPDGSIAAYSWTFGDGGTGSGATATHTYAGAGTYTVRLTVTDDKGATASTTRQVTVNAPSVLAQDNFGRTVTNGWGTADSGQAWTLTTATTNFNVANGAGTIRMAAGSGPGAYLSMTPAGDVDVTVNVAYDKLGTGSGAYTSVIGRRNGTSDYRLRVRELGSTVTVYIDRTVNGTATTLATQTVTSSYTAGQVIKLRFQIQGTGTTTLRAKAWTSANEPAAWTATATDSTAALQNPGAVGIYTYLSGSANNAPIVLTVDNLRVEPLG